MAKLIRLDEISDEKLLDIFNSEITVYEDIQGSKIYVNWNGESFSIKPKSLSYEDINLIDLAMQNYYNIAIDYLNSLDDRIKSLLNKKWWFGFEYFPDNQPANIEYNRIPKNNLVLTCIAKNGKFEYNIEELEEYARLIGVDSVPVIFSGKLNEKSKEAIKYFLNTSEKDLEFVFGEKSFSYFFYKLLSPQTKNSFLMDEDFQKNTEKMIIRVVGQDISFEILNPLYRRISDMNSTDFVEIYSLILVNFLNFCQIININELKAKGNKRDEMYINIICKLFNMYLAEVKDDLLNFEFSVPEFFDKDKFRINVELIPNNLTKEYIEQNKKFEYIFKAILGSFNKKRKKPIGIFTDSTIIIFNNFVDAIQSKIDMSLKKKSELELTRSGLLDFGDFFDIKFNTDAEGQVYPDVYTELENGKGDDKKKKDKGIIDTKNMYNKK